MGRLGAVRRHRRDGGRLDHRSRRAGRRPPRVNVELRDSELVITGEIKERERNGILRRRTRRTGHFEYRVVLPGQATDEGIEANLHDGVLTVRVPKPEQSRPRRIEVKSD